jgi:DNA-binding transcriptional ArsR family regulator
LPDTYDLRLYEMKAGLCKTFSDARRLIIISELCQGERTVGELTRVVNIAQASVSRHLAVLRQRRLVNARREGTRIHYSLSDPTIRDACQIVHQLVLNQMEETRRLADRIL